MDNWKGSLRKRLHTVSQFFFYYLSVLKFFLLFLSILVAGLPRALGQKPIQIEQLTLPTTGLARHLQAAVHGLRLVVPDGAGSYW